MPPPAAITPFNVHQVRANAPPRLEHAEEAAVRRQLEKILQSPVFCSSRRMQRFLAFVVTESLAGRAHRLKEYTIGVEAFDRPEAFSPVEDPIVRVEARRLRDKLAQYYQQSGRLDEVVIEVPRGRYVPSFSFRCDDNGCRFTQTVLTIEPFTATGDQGDAFREALIHELVDQLVRVRGFPVNIGPEPVHSCLALTGCIQILPTGVRVIAQLVTAPQ